MSVNNSWDRVPGPDTPYGEMLTYWMNRLGISNRDLALRTSIDRTYPGHIKSGRKTPHLAIANKIRNHLLAVAQEPGPNESPRLTEPERTYMDDLLQQSFDRANKARGRSNPHEAEVTETEPPLSDPVAPLQEDTQPPAHEAMGAGMEASQKP